MSLLPFLQPIFAGFELLLSFNSRTSMCGHPSCRTPFSHSCVFVLHHYCSCSHYRGMNASICKTEDPRHGHSYQALVVEGAKNEKWKDVEYRVDLTATILAEAYLGMAMTVFVTGMFIWASIFFTSDANRMIVKPVERMTAIMAELSESLFGASSGKTQVKSMEISQLEHVIAAMARFFNGIVYQKQTVLYAPDGSSWCVDVSHSEPGEGIEGMESRIVRDNIADDAWETTPSELMSDPVVVGYLQAFGVEVRARACVRLRNCAGRATPHNDLSHACHVLLSS